MLVSSSVGAGAYSGHMIDGGVGDVIGGSGPAGGLAVLETPGSGVGAALGQAGQALDRAQQAAEFLTRDVQGELVGHLGVLQDMRLTQERLLLSVVREAAERGLPDEVGLSLHDWVSGQCPWLAPADVSDLVAVTRALKDPAHQSFREAVAQGRLPVRRAAKGLRALERVRPACDEETYAGDVEIILGAVSRVEFTDRDLRRVADRLVSAALPEREVAAREGSVRELRGVHESSLADGTLTRFVVTCEPEGAAFFRQVLTSPLAAPAPDAMGPDPRTPTQRRYDALVTVLGRGVGAPQGTPGTAKAKVLLTVSLADLQGMVLDQPGVTLGGDVVPPTVVRKLACEADLVPMILGKGGVLLETVQPTRYATEKQLLALYARDGHCTFPGCTVPPEWCDAHHVVWWSRGGKTYLLNLALLCGRHHTIVHQKDLTATIDETGVTWHV
ncbi:uncharacterized protein DUF222 [Ornithinicoccus hortensis]|uniref:Uncharacterized protein DUF222 n=2 Tax=Ornithinicoccus hortensis TaxID=82346 RepID=A0A542YN54_9MICO|nr:uncharacterized protein DUF222 [Ornithinicoccus hortensis]